MSTTRKIEVKNKGLIDSGKPGGTKKKETRVTASSNERKEKLFRTPRKGVPTSTRTRKCV
jgi:hypothetical protein